MFININIVNYGFLSAYIVIYYISLHKDINIQYYGDINRTNSESKRAIQH